jgi:hypothetical protein
MAIPSQLWRTVLSGSSLSADQQNATPDDHGSYGELADAIDEIVGSPARRKTSSRKPRTRAPKRSGASKRSAS